MGFVHTTLEEFENGAVFFRLGLQFTLIRHENGAFRKRCSIRRNLKTMAFRFLVDGKYFENVALISLISLISLTEFSSYTSPK